MQKIQDRRIHKRLDLRFPTKLNALGLNYPVEGETENLSQGGALIKTRSWYVFQHRDRTLVTIFIPPDFSGQETTIGLQGSAVIIRIDQDNELVALQFVKSFKQFERQN
jgi:hypothetical protein